MVEMPKNIRPAGQVSDAIAKIETVTFTGNRGLSIEEPLIFEIGTPETCGVDFEEIDDLMIRDGLRPPHHEGTPHPEERRSRVSKGEAVSRLGNLAPREPIGLPGLSEPQAVRHYVRLSQKNYSIDTGIFPARLLHHEA